MGASWSGLDAVRAAFDASGLCGALGLQSLAMLDSDEAELLPALRTASERLLRLYHDWARYDAHATREAWDMRTTNARFHEVLRRKEVLIS